MNRRLALKTASYGVIHVAVATSIAYLLTGDLAAAAGIGLLEPIVQTGVFAIHERIWESAPAHRGARDDRVQQGPGTACCLRIEDFLMQDSPDRAHVA